MPQPNVSGMDPPFGDAFCNRPFPDQALTSTDLLGNNSDPDFMYELGREMTYTHSSRDDPLILGDCKDIEIFEPLNELLDSDPSYNSNWEQWDTCWEDLTKYTKLTSYDIWGTKEVDFLGLDDFSSPYQNEEVISRTPTLAQLNCEDSQPVLDSLYHPDLLKSLNQNSFTSSLAGKKLPNRVAPPVSSVRSPCIDACLPETTQMVAKSVSSSATVDISNKLEPLNAKIGSVLVDSKDFVKKAKLWINPAPLGKSTLGATQVHSDLPDDSCCSAIGPAARKLEKKNAESIYSNKTPTVVKEANDPNTQTEAVEMLSPPVSGHTQKKEEHNYSLFVSDGLNEQSPSIEQEAEDDEDEEDDEDHDEGFGSEHEYSDNEEDDDDDDDDEEDDKDDDVSDTFSEPGKYLVKKSRRTDVEDLTPNPRKLLQIGNELRKLNKVISDLTPVSELPLTARPRSRKEKNKLASRACRLKKKAQYEANKVKLWGLNTEYDHLLYVINSIKQEIVNRVQSQSGKGRNSMLEKLENLFNETLGTTVAGQTSDFVNQVLEKTGEGDPTGGLEGLRVPTSKV
ncbi:hypothetical protein scyTo_0010190 [Scyliorhinus torazame]|uniref:BZIP domain-containing protein n=1 Tax=Scyliorhinus torazame TaxID=75743 RepID=A0A401P1S0_SCYTO|nr:hypothetical protein [Scyliorhinus torazame]